MVGPVSLPEVLELPEASEGAETLFVHAPYPGRLRFHGVPGSLLAAAAPYVRALAASGDLGTVGLLDPGEASAPFYERLEGLLRRGSVRGVCISTSTAAIEEAGRIARLVKASAPGALVVLGGPHEDGSPGSALRLPGVDLSLGAGSGAFLAHTLKSFRERDQEPAAFVRELGPGQEGPSADLTAWSAHWPHGGERHLRKAPASLASELPIVRPAKRVSFDVFGGRETIPLMVSRGCSYGRCTFCAEGGRKRAEVSNDFGWVAALAASQPEAAIYFQDSIFPSTRSVRRELLPLLRDLNRPWGCQVFLPMLSREFLRELRASGVTYLYTGLESGSERIVDAVGKRTLSRNLVLERLSWIREEGIAIGISLMFGAMTTSGELLETEATLRETESLAESIVKLGIDLAGFYSNVQTVLPGTALANGLSNAGHKVDFYRMPRAAEFEAFEDGAIGHNFLTLASRANVAARQVLAAGVQTTASFISSLAAVRSPSTFLYTPARPVSA